MPRQNVAGVDLGPDGDLISIGKAKALVAAVVAQDIAEQAKLVQAALVSEREYTDNQGRGTMALLTVLEQSVLSRLNLLNAEFRAYEARTLAGRTRRVANVVRGWLSLTPLKPAWEVDEATRVPITLASGFLAATEDAQGSPFARAFVRPLGATPAQASPQLVRD